MGLDMMAAKGYSDQFKYNLQMSNFYIIFVSTNNQLFFIKENEMSLTKSFYDAELMQNENEEEQQELNAMFYYELNRRQQLWFESLPNLTQAEMECYLQLPESHWFSPMFEAWMQVQNESKAIDAMLRPQIRMVDRNQLEDENIWTNIFSVDTEANRADLISRNGDL